MSLLFIKIIDNRKLLVGGIVSNNINSEDYYRFNIFRFTVLELDKNGNLNHSPLINNNTIEFIFAGQY